MADTKYGKYIIREPLEKGRAPMLHICAEEGCLGAQFAGFPVEVQLLTITEPISFPHPPHVHDADEHAPRAPHMKIEEQGHRRKRQRPASESGASMVPVTLETVVTETGMLQLWCVARDGRRWKLEFNVREGAKSG